MRAIARTEEYRAHAGKLVSRYPDEVWREPGEGWIATFPLQAGKFGQQLLYILEEPSSDRPTVVKEVSWVASEGFEVPDPRELGV